MTRNTDLIPDTTADEGRPTEAENATSLVAEAPASAKQVKAEWVDSDIARYPMEGGFDGAERNWPALSRQIWQLSRMMACFLLFAMLAGWPLGDYLAHRNLYGSDVGWSLFSAYPAGIIMFALVVPALVLFSGYVLSRAMTTTQAAESMAAAARAYTAPDSVALQEIETVGTAIRTQMDGLNTGLDAALIRLADAEALIRKHVDAIETAGAAIETKATDAMDRVVVERTRLIEATEKLNTQADGFAEAIAERTQANITAMDQANEVSQQVEDRFDARLGGLEQATNSALESFKHLLDALGNADGEMRSTSDALKEAAERTVAATLKTREATTDARQAAEQAAQSATENALSQSMIEAAVEANRENITRAVNETSEKAGEEAVAIARAEAEKIARVAIDSAGLDVERIARGASEELERRTLAGLAQTQGIAEAAEKQQQELAKVHEALRAENSRLEQLIEEQNQRAERLAMIIAEQSEQLAKLADATPVSEVGLVGAQEVSQPHMQTTNLHGTNGKDQKRSSDGDTSFVEANPDLYENSLNLRFSGVDSPIADPPAKKADDDFAEAVKSPAQDLQRLNDIARDLTQSREARAREIAEHDDHAEPTTPEQPEPLTLKRAATKDFNATPSWKEILAAADDAEALDIGNSEHGDDSEFFDASHRGAQGANGRNSPSDGMALSSHSVDQDALVLDKINLMPDASHMANSLPLEDADKLDERALRAFRVIHRLQQFTLNLDHRLYGECPHALVERFDHGDRNVFANRLLRLNETDVKKRIRVESANDKKFESDIREFLKQFDSLLEEAAMSPSVDEELREYLSSPLGRIYLLIGEIVGYFA